MRQARWMCEMCARQRARELLQASWRRVEVPPPRNAGHVAQATGGWLPRIGKRETALPAQASGAVRSDVAQHCHSRADLERRKVMSVVAHGLKPDLLRAPRDGVPQFGGRASGADRCTPPESRAGEGSQSVRSAALKPTLSQDRHNKFVELRGLTAA